MTAQRHPDRAASPELPAWQLAEWDGNRLLNPSIDHALWSGRFDPPAIGAIVITSGKIQHRATITGYKVDSGWLMLVGYRTDDPAHQGDLAGIEIHTVIPAAVAASPYVLCMRRADGSAPILTAADIYAVLDPAKEDHARARAQIERLCERGDTHSGEHFDLLAFAHNMAKEA